MFEPANAFSDSERSSPAILHKGEERRDTGLRLGKAMELCADELEEEALARSQGTWVGRSRIADIGERDRFVRCAGTGCESGRSEVQLEIVQVGCGDAGR